jgi:ubiquitin-like-conjugating enzyme ATG3
VPLREAGDPKNARPYLPPDKQFLMTRRVPCRARVASLSGETYDETLPAGEDGDWMTTHVRRDGDGDDAPAAAAEANGSVDDMSELEDIGSPNSGGSGAGSGSERAAAEPEVGAILVAALSLAAAAPAAGAAPAAAEEGDYDDLADFEEEGLLVVDDAVAIAEAPFPSGGSGGGGGGLLNVVATRTYDLSLTYDKYYQTPRVWLFGYSERNQPLSADAVMEDVMQDYAHKTVTVDPHPHWGTPHASVHPCKHAQTMKRIVDALQQHGGAPPNVAQYLFVFLKFIGSVVPTIEYDFTMATAAR